VHLYVIGGVGVGVECGKPLTQLRQSEKDFIPLASSASIWVCDWKPASSDLERNIKWGNPRGFDDRKWAIL